MTHPCTEIEEHDLPSVEAALACTLVLMTGYGQALQAELHPGQRLTMGEKVMCNLRLLADHPQLSLGFRQVLHGLETRWQAMGACTLEAAQACEGCSAPRPAAALPAFEPGRRRLH